jgi:hypothetical protein
MFQSRLSLCATQQLGRDESNVNSNTPLLLFLLPGTGAKRHCMPLLIHANSIQVEHGFEHALDLNDSEWSCGHYPLLNMVNHNHNQAHCFLRISIF